MIPRVKQFSLVHIPLWIHRQLESMVTSPLTVVQLLALVHFFQDIVGWVSAVSVPTCWAATAEIKERTARDNMLPTLMILKYLL